MDSSHIVGDDAEECHSSESGWTMYIGSPIHSDDDDDDDGDGDDQSGDGDKNGDDCDDHGAKPGDDSDDSMASDASSGPSHRGHSWRNGEVPHYKHQEDKDEGKHCSNKPAKNPIEKKIGYPRRKQEKEKSVFTAKSSDKARKNRWSGKRK